jgi:hypothetical protein
MMSDPKANLQLALERKRRLLSSDAAADYVGLGRSTMPKFRISGDGPRYCKLAGRVLYDVADLDAYVEASKHTSTAAA